MTIFDKGKAFIKQRSSKPSESSTAPNKLLRPSAADEKEVAHANRKPTVLRFETEILPELPAPPPPPVPSANQVIETHYYGIHGELVPAAYMTQLPGPAFNQQQQFQLQPQQNIWGTPRPGQVQVTQVTPIRPAPSAVYPAPIPATAIPHHPAHPPPPPPHPALQVLADTVKPLIEAQSQHPKYLTASVVLLWTLTLAFIFLVAPMVMPVFVILASCACFGGLVYAAMMTARAHFAAQAAKYSKEQHEFAVTARLVETKLRIKAAETGSGNGGGDNQSSKTGISRIADAAKKAIDAPQKAPQRAPRRFSTGAKARKEKGGFSVPATYEIEEVD